MKATQIAVTTCILSQLRSQTPLQQKNDPFVICVVKYARSCGTGENPLIKNWTRTAA
jgi:hypothetical protein